MYECMKAAMPLKGKGKEDLLYLVPPTNMQFLINKKSPIHACRYAVTDKNHVLNVHVDSQNPRDNITLPNYYMNQPVGCYGSMTGAVCHVVIAYGKDSVVNASLRYNKYAPFLKCIYIFFEKVHEDRREITTSCVQYARKQIQSGTNVARLDVHINKMVFYSPFIYQILHMQNKHHLDQYQVASLVYCTILSETPDHFMKATSKLNNNKTIWKTSNYKEIAVQLYNKIWEEKKYYRVKWSKTCTNCK